MDDDPWKTIAFEMFAMHQDVSMSELEPMGATPRLQAPRYQSPDWFAAASSPDASLLDMAPELLAIPPASQADDELTTTVAPDSDIIGIYAPETTGDYARPSRNAVPAPAPEPVPAPVDGDEDQHPRTAVQMGLLKELSELDQ